MATMYPSEMGPDLKTSDGKKSPTPGERQLFHFFQTAAKPDSAYSVWFEPLLGEKRLESDFLLFNKEIGFVIIEVKDWSIDRIEKANQDHFQIRDNGRRRNPEKQVRSYFYALQDQLKDLGFTKPNGSISIPIATMIAFPNISRSDYNSKTGFRLTDVLPEKMLLLSDDINFLTDLSSDESGESFLKLLRKLSSSRCPQLSPSELNRLYDGIWPSRGTKLPPRKGSTNEEFNSELACLDATQARVARKLGRGHQILRGAPGTGKSIILAHRCRYLHDFDPEDQLNFDPNSQALGTCDFWLKYILFFLM